jgi:glucokinase
MPSPILGIDLGGTTFTTGSVDESGSVSFAFERETHQHEGPDQLLPRLAEAAQEVLEHERGSGGTKIGALGIGVPGPVKHREGICVYAPNLDGWSNLPVAPPLRERLGIPVYLLNDANAAALGEARFGAGQGARSMLMLTLGTGIGSGLILDHQLYLGATERGAEVGHTTVDFDSKRGSAGNIGTLESVCGRDAIVWRALRHLANGRASILQDVCGGDLTTMTPRHIAEAASAGDETARQVWEDTAVYLAVGIINVVFTADVERVVVGGGIAQAGSVLFDPLRRAVTARTSRLVFDVSQIVPAKLGPEAGLIGAAQWARERLAAYE